MFARLRDDEPLQTMAYTLFGLLYVIWLFNFMTKIVYITPRSSTGMVTGQFYCSVSDRGDEVQRHGRLSDRQRYWTTPDDSAHQREKNMGRILRRACFFAALQSGSDQTDAGHLSALNLTDATSSGCFLASPRSLAILPNRSSNGALA